MGSGDEIKKVILDLDNDEFVKKLKESLGLLGEFGDGKSLEGLISNITEVGKVLGIVAAAGLAVKAAVDWTEEAEKINQVNNSYKALAASVGLAGTELKEKLLASTKGLIDDTALLESVNKVIVTLGDNANRIPEIMELSRKATILFGGELTANFEKISMALNSGNTRMLRHYGLVVNATKAQDDYAKSLGISREYLDEAGKRLAVMNAALEAGQEKFKNVDENSLQATQGVKRISTSMSELGEVALHVWDVVFGPAVKAGVGVVASLFDSIATHAKAWLGTEEQQMEANNKLLAERKTTLEGMVEYAKSHPGLGWQSTESFVRETNEELAKVNQQLAAANINTEKKIALEKQAAGKTGGDGGVDQQKLLQARQKFEQDIAKIHLARVQSDLAVETNADAAEAQVHQKSVAIQQQADAEWAQTRKRMMDLGLGSEQQLEKARVDIYQKANNQVVQNERQVNAERLKALKNLELANQETAKGITAAFAHEGEQAKQNFNNMAKLGSTAFNSIGSNAKQAFEDLGNGSKDAAGALRGFFFGAIGDIAVQQGEIMLLMGIWPPNPLAIAAGGALVALGSAIKGLGGASGGGSTASASGVGGAVSEQASQVDTSANTAAAQPASRTQAQIVIQGNYFETDQTRNRLMEIIREAGDQTDFQLKQIGQA